MLPLWMFFVINTHLISHGMYFKKRNLTRLLFFRGRLQGLVIVNKGWFWLFKIRGHDDHRILYVLKHGIDRAVVTLSRRHF